MEMFFFVTHPDCDPPADAVRYLACICIGKLRLSFFLLSLAESNHLCVCRFFSLDNRNFSFDQKQIQLRSVILQIFKFLYPSALPLADNMSSS